MTQQPGLKHSELPPGLRRFFDAVTPLLQLKAEAEEVERSIGASPSGTRRLGFYGVLARRNRFIALRQICPALRHAALNLDPPVWRDLVAFYAVRHPPAHPDPNRFGEQLAEFIASERERGWQVPGYLEELADFEFTEWLVGVLDFEPSSDDPGLDRTIQVRHYGHDIPRFVEGFRTGNSTQAPEAKPTAVIIYRDLRTQLPRTFFPTPLGLAALARRAHRKVSLQGVDENALGTVERELERHGVLPVLEA